MPAHFTAYGARCKTCVYWSPTSSRIRDTPIGICRRGLPVMVPGASEPLRGCWPETRDGDWCGEHRFNTDADHVRTTALPVPSSGASSPATRGD